ncbi:MAG: glycosyltransferase [Elusimicrobiales bacterium]
MTPEGEKKKPLVYLVVPNKNGMAHLSYAMPSLFATEYPNFKAVVIDNRSSDGSVAYLAANYPDAEVLVNERDLGFAGSVNRGVLHALSRGADYVAIYSNDIKVVPRWLDLSIEVFAAHPEAGAVGYMEIPKEKDAPFLEYKAKTAVSSPAAALPGCLLLCSAEVFTRAGLMDEGYFMYGEDNDFFARIKAAGLALLQTDIPVWHYGEGSAAKKRLFPVWMAYRNAVRSALKNQGLSGAARVTAVLFYHGCLPHFERDITDPSLKRTRRYNPLVNLALLAGSLGWNAVNFIPTLKARSFNGAAAARRARSGGNKLRVAVVNLTGGGTSGGYLRYLENMLPRLAASPLVEKVLCSAPPYSGIGEIASRAKGVIVRDCDPARPMLTSHGRKLELALKEFDPDILFVPTARPLRFGDVPVVTMIQNMAPMKPSGDYPLMESLRMLVQRLEVRRAVNSADGVIAMSGFVREFLTTEWGIPADKVSLVYFGAPSAAAGGIKPAAAPAGLEGGFFFSAGSLEPYRGMEDILYAVSALKKDGFACKVLIAGGARKAVAGYGLRLRSIARREGIEDSVVWLGALSPEEMAWCYARCSAFLMTSRVESLAVTALEAIANGCVCVSVDRAPLPEAFGTAAFYYSCGDHVALAEKMRAAFALSPEERAAMSGIARQQASKFSWDATASETVRVFSAVAGCRRGAR